MLCQNSDKAFAPPHAARDRGCGRCNSEDRRQQVGIFSKFRQVSEITKDRRTREEAILLLFGHLSKLQHSPHPHTRGGTRPLQNSAKPAPGPSSGRMAGRTHTVAHSRRISSRPMSLHLRGTSFVDFGQLSKLHTPTRARRHFCRILQKSTLVPRTYTREEAINAAGNVIGNVTVNVSCV